jgi:hypothetical protein
MDGDTVHLGRLLAAAGVTELVVVTATAPTLSGDQQPILTPPPSELVPALERQVDLFLSPGSGGGVLAFVNRASHGVTSTRPGTLDPQATAGGYWASRNWTPALDPATLSGRVARGTLFVGYAPAGDFVATVDGAPVPRGSAYGLGSAFKVPAGTAQVSLDAFPWNGILASLVLALWLGVGVLVLGPDRVARAWRRLFARPSGAGDGPDLDPGAADVPAAVVHDGARPLEEGP